MKMAVSIGHDDLSMKIISALGLPEHGVYFKLEMAVDSITTVTYKYYPEKDSLEKIIPILKEYELVKKEVNENGTKKKTFSK